MPGDGVEEPRARAEGTPRESVDGACTQRLGLVAEHLPEQLGRSLLGYSIRGSPRMPASFPAARTASWRPPSSSTSFSSLAFRPVKTRPSATLRTSASGSFRDSATAPMNWPCTSSSIAWK